MPFAFAVATLALAAVQADYRAQYPLPGPVVGQGWGVNIHFTREQPGELRMIRDAGFKWVRMDMTWSKVEKVRGVFDFTEYDALVRGLDANGLRAIFILDYGNALYQANPPNTREGREGYARFAAAAAERYQGIGVLWEIWNEPNHIQFWKPAPNVADYVALAKETVRAIRRSNPQEWIVGPAVSGFDWGFLEGCFQAGLLKDLDAVSVHPYRMVEPESVAADWNRLRQLVRRYAPRGKNIPLLSGEWGYSEKYADMNEVRQADFVTRQMLTNLASGVNLSVWYDWKDDGLDDKEVEHHFGIVDTALRPKAAYMEIQRLSQSLGGATFVRRINGSGGRHDLAFRHGGAAKLVAWSSGSRRETSRRGNVEYGPRPWIGPAEADDLKEPLAKSRVVDGEADVTASPDSIPIKLLFQPTRRTDRVSMALDNPTGAVLTVMARSTSDSLPVTFRAGETRKRFSLAAKSQVEIVADGQVILSRKIPTISHFALLGAQSLTEAGLKFDLDGNSQIPAAQTASIDAEGVVTLDYQSSPGWRFFRLSTVGANRTPDRGKPTAILMRVFGDGQGVLLRARFIDATGQTFQPDYGPINWIGWRTVRFPIDQSAAARWGGGKDGVVHFPVVIDCPLVIDPLSRASQGQIKVKDLALEYQPS